MPSLTPVEIDLFDPVFNAIVSWPFGEEFVRRVLIEEIPQRVKYERAKIWVYLDAEKTVVGFGTMAVSIDYVQLTGGEHHMYIPLLAVHPACRGKGYGRAILEHLIEEASCSVSASPELHRALFLDVYEDSVEAIKLYTRNGFVTLADPVVDPVNAKRFHIMACPLPTAS